MFSLDYPTWFLALMIAPFGLAMGSFANVLIYRLPLEEPEDRNVVTKSSHCPSCKAPIKPWHNIPLFGWLWLRGKCAACGWKIPGRYPLVELLGGLIFAASVYLFPVGSLIWFKALVCAFALLVLFFTDYTEFFLPDVLQFPLMILGVLFTLPQLFWPNQTVTILIGNQQYFRADLFHNGLQMSPLWTLFGEAVTWKSSLLGLVVGYGGPTVINAIYKLIRKTDGLGMGDFKMLAWLGAFWGWAPMLGIFFGGALLLTAFSLPLIITRRLKGQSMLPFGCFLALATFPVVFYGPAIWSWYMGTMVR